MFMRAGDILSGQTAKAIANIGGRVEDMFYARNLEATLTKHKDPIRVLGIKGDQHKASGWEGTGSLNVFYVTSVFRRMALNYAKNGVDTYFTLTVTNEDPTSTVGKQTVVLYNCNIDSVVLTKFDTETNYLDEDIDFTFDGFDILDEFGNPTPTI